MKPYQLLTASVLTLACLTSCGSSNAKSTTSTPTSHVTSTPAAVEPQTQDAPQTESIAGDSSSDQGDTTITFDNSEEQVVAQTAPEYMSDPFADAPTETGVLVNAQHGVNFFVTPVANAHAQEVQINSVLWEGYAQPQLRIDRVLPGQQRAILPLTDAKVYRIIKVCFTDATNDEAGIDNSLIRGTFLWLPESGSTVQQDAAQKPRISHCPMLETNVSNSSVEVTDTQAPLD